MSLERSKKFLKILEKIIATAIIIVAICVALIWHSGKLS